MTESQQQEMDFLNDKDLDTFPEETNSTSNRLSQAKSSRRIPAEEAALSDGKPTKEDQLRAHHAHQYAKIYKKPSHIGCTTHLFCQRETMLEEVKPFENYPLPGVERWLDPKDKNKRAPAREKEVHRMFEDFLKKDFYYRNINEKKKLL